MVRLRKKPRVLLVTPEITYLPESMGNISRYVAVKAGGLGEVIASLTKSLYEHGADVHVALPHYRRIFKNKINKLFDQNSGKTKNCQFLDRRIHLAEDRAFYYIDSVYSAQANENTKISLAFQREVINNIVPFVRPDLIHCHDWMSGLIPAMARNMGIPCLFTIHNVFTVKETLSAIEERGIDAAPFWKNLFFARPPLHYEESRETNPVDFLSSGVFAAHFINTVSPTFLRELIEGKHWFAEESLKRELKFKLEAGCAVGILNSPDPSFNPGNDQSLPFKYNAGNFALGKTQNKQRLQKMLGLLEDEHAALFFWPSRLDSIQKGSPLMSHILYDVISKYWRLPLQIVFVADGEFQQYMRQIVSMFNLSERVAVCDFDDSLSRLAYAASDFILMPSAYEPCGLTQMIAPLYGSLPVGRDTGGIHDTIKDLNIEKNSGNGFLFESYDPEGLMWAIEQAVSFFQLPPIIKESQIARIMTESLASFHHSVTANHYIDLYERMLRRPFLPTR